MFGDFSINGVLINGLKKYSNIMLTFNKPLCVTVLHYFLIFLTKLVSLIVVHLAALLCHCWEKEWLCSSYRIRYYCLDNKNVRQ